MAGKGDAMRKKAKFRVGQVVRVEANNLRVFKIVGWRRLEDGSGVIAYACDLGDEYLEEDLRPLTARERGPKGKR